MSGVIGRVKSIPANIKATANDLLKRSAMDAVVNSGRRFGHSNRAALKGIGSGVRGLGSRLRRRK